MELERFTFFRFVKTDIMYIVLFVENFQLTCFKYVEK